MHQRDSGQEKKYSSSFLQGAQLSSILMKVSFQGWCWRERVLRKDAGHGYLRGQIHGISGIRL